MFASRASDKSCLIVETTENLMKSFLLVLMGAVLAATGFAAVGLFDRNNRLNELERDAKFLAYHQAGVQHLREGEYEDALLSLKQAKRLARSDLLKSDVHFGIGSAYLGTNMPKMALESFEASWELNQSAWTGRYLCAMYSVSADDDLYSPEKALVTATALQDIQEVPEYKRHHHMAMALAANKRFDEAIEYQVKAMERWGTEGIVHANFRIKDEDGKTQHGARIPSILYRQLQCYENGYVWRDTESESRYDNMIRLGDFEPPK